MVEASLAKTLVALIPFTKAYREANEAMFELNNIKGMQAEVARCKDVKELLDQGLHEEALGEMMTGEVGWSEATARSISNILSTRRFAPRSSLLAPCLSLRSQRPRLSLRSSPSPLLLADTTMDFHDFNKTKHVMRQEGTWTYETMRQKLKRIETEAQDKGLGEG